MGYLDKEPELDLAREDGKKATVEHPVLISF